MTVINVIVTIATVILVYVALSDIRSRKISNTASGLLFVNSMLYCGLLGYWTQLLVVIPVFIFGFLLWQIGIWGAGDAKLLAAIVPMIQLNHLASVLLLIACFGGILAIVMWVLSRLTTRNTYKHVPYGVPISIGCWLGVIASIP